MKKLTTTQTILIAAALIILLIFINKKFAFLGAILPDQTNSQGTYGEGTWIIVDSNNDGTQEIIGSVADLFATGKYYYSKYDPVNQFDTTPEGYPIVRIDNSCSPSTPDSCPQLMTSEGVTHIIYVLIDEGNPSFLSAYPFLPEPSPSAAPEIALAQATLQPIIEVEEPVMPQGGLCDAVPQLTCPDGSPAPSAILTSPEGDPNCVWEPVCPIQCPQIAPTAPGWCADGTITPPVQDANGCWGAPKCIMPTQTTPTSSGGGGGGGVGSGTTITPETGSGCTTPYITDNQTGQCILPEQKTPIHTKTIWWIIATALTIYIFRKKISQKIKTI